MYRHNVFSLGKSRHDYRVCNKKDEIQVTMKKKDKHKPVTG